MKKTDFDLHPVYQEFLQYAPAYARLEAQAAIAKVADLRAQGLLGNGVYYIVLADIVGGTKMGDRLGNEEMAKRIQIFITESFNALNDAKLSNSGVFLKEIGDAVLWVFSHFPDVLKWQDAFAARLALANQYQWKEDPVLFRTVVHVGEVYLSGVNPVALAVSQVFKLEKKAAAGQILLSETAYAVAWPSLARAHYAFEEAGSISVEGHSVDMKLYLLKTTKLSTPTAIALEVFDE